MASRPEFGANTEGKEVVAAFPLSVQNKTILITGVSSNGLGEVLAQTLAIESPKLLILTGRDTSKVSAVTKALSITHPNIQTRILKLDVSSLSSVRAAAEEVNAYPEPNIDILINNAGVMNIPSRTVSVDGFEMHLATNYLGLFLFTNSIMKKLMNSEGGGRIVNVSSNGYIFSPFRFSDWNFEGKEIPENEYPPKELCEGYGLPWGLGYLPTIAYGQSKTAVMLYAVQLAKLVKDKGVTCVNVHPGAIATNLWRHMPKEATEQMFTVLPMKTLSQGISTILVAALDPELAGSAGVYLEDCQPQQLADFAKDASIAERLWKLSEELVGCEFSF